MLKKEFKKKDVERMRNLIRGNANDSSETQFGELILVMVILVLLQYLLLVQMVMDLYLNMMYRTGIMH